MSGVLGVVLAGGASRRFGSDKALAIAFGRPLIDHAISALLAVLDAVAVAGRDWPGMGTLEDRPGPGLGPLGGLNGALHHARQLGFEWVVSIACDTPFVPPDLLRALIAQGGANYLEAHPVIGLWPVDRADHLNALLAADGSRSIRCWAASIGARSVHTDREIANLNYAADLSALVSKTRLADIKIGASLTCG